jgi:hypothetical protein
VFLGACVLLFALGLAIDNTLLQIPALALVIVMVSVEFVFP